MAHGKSTLLKAILGEVKHTGIIEFQDVREEEFKDLKIGYVPQQINVEKHMPTTVYDFMAAIISNRPIWLKKDKNIERKLREHLEIFEASKLIDKSIGDLSGGELQRVLLAVATIDEPNLLILDEPVSGIDKNGIKVATEEGVLVIEKLQFPNGKPLFVEQFINGNKIDIGTILK